MGICVKPKVGILLIATGRFRQLGQDTAAGTYEQRKQQEAESIIQLLGSSCEIIFPGIVYTREDLALATRAFMTGEADCVFALFLSWSEDFAWVRFLRDMPPVPVILASRTPDRIPFQNTNAESDFVDFLSYGGLVGTLEGSGSVRRFARPMFRTVIGTLAEIAAKTVVFAEAAAIRSLLRRSSFGLLASYNEVMWSTYVDPYNLFMKMGPELRFLSVMSLCDEIAAVDAAEVSGISRLLGEKYPLLPDVNLEFFDASVRASLALDNLARKAGVQAIVLNDVDPVLLDKVGLRPGFLPLPGRGDITVVPEGDIGGGLAVFILRQFSGLPVNFIEPFYIDLERNCFAGGHAGPNDYTDPAGAVRIARDVRFARTAYKYAGAPFAWYVIPAGLKTMLHISECNGRFKMAAALVEALPAEHFITSYTHGLFRPVHGPVTSLFEQLIQIGVTQHYGLVDGDILPQLGDLARLLDMDLTILS